MTGPHEAGPPVPEEVLAAAKAAFRCRVGDPELAPLAFDSLLDGTDGPAGHRLRFEHAQLAVELNVRSTSAGAELWGRALGSSAPATSVVTAGADPEVKAEIHESGGFELGGIGHGRLRLVFDRPGAAPIATDWFRV